MLTLISCILMITVCYLFILGTIWWYDKVNKENHERIQRWREMRLQQIEEQYGRGYAWSSLREAQREAQRKKEEAMEPTVVIGYRQWVRKV